MANIDYLLRPATEADYQYCYDLTKQNMFELFCRHWGAWNPSAFRNDFNARNTTIVIVDEQQIGYFSLKKIDQYIIYLENIQLLPEIQGQGIGTAILEDIFRNNAFCSIHLTTFLDNPALRLYKSLGFVITERDGATVYMERKSKIGINYHSFVD